MASMSHLRSKDADEDPFALSRECPSSHVPPSSHRSEYHVLLQLLDCDLLAKKTEFGEHDISSALLSSEDVTEGRRVAPFKPKDPPTASFAFSSASTSCLLCSLLEDLHWTEGEEGVKGTRLHSESVAMRTGVSCQEDTHSIHFDRRETK